MNGCLSSSIARCRRTGAVWQSHVRRWYIGGCGHPARPSPHNDYVIPLQRRAGTVSDSQGLLSPIPRGISSNRSLTPLMSWAYRPRCIGSCGNYLEVARLKRR